MIVEGIDLSYEQIIVPDLKMLSRYTNNVMKQVNTVSFF